jgi:hypothetical protein
MTKDTNKPLFRDLKADEIDCRVGTIRANGLSLLLYKDSRVDQNILDETFGAFNWQRRHSRDNANCEVGVWDSEKQQWIWKEDTGTESFTEKEKGIASDSFKRACFNWGIGRELYTAPFIWIPSTKCTIEEKNGKYVCENIFLDGYDGNVTIDCLKTSQGAYWCPTSAISIAFDEWYSEWFSYSENQDDTNIEAYRYTANKKSVNELFFRYKYFGLITDADECAYDYFWKNSSSRKLGFSITIIITLILLF